MLIFNSRELNPPIKAARSDDPKLLKDMLEISGTKIVIQANETGLEFEHQTILIGNAIASFAQYSQGFSYSRDDQSDRLMILIPLTGEAQVHIGTQCIDANADTIVFASSRQMSRFVTGPNRSHLIIEIPQQDLRRKLAELSKCTIRESISFQMTMKTESDAGRPLCMLAKALFEGIGAARSTTSFTHHSLMETILCCLLENVWHNYANAMEHTENVATPKYIERAIAHMQANLPEPLTVELVAAEVNVSPRTLQQGFKQFRGTTPMAYLKELRMQAAHRELEWAPPGVSVGDIGRRWGFVHLGRFAAEYRERFGKAPSGTLKGL